MEKYGVEHGNLRRHSIRVLLQVNYKLSQLREDSLVPYREKQSPRDQRVSKDVKFHILGRLHCRTVK